MIKLSNLYRRLDYHFNDEELLKNALTHRSRDANNNERLEFLGDAILSFVVSELLFESFPKANEGDLSRLRAYLVNGETLADIARELELGDFLLLGQGEMRSGGFRRDSILADTFEAIVAAVFLDSSIAECRKLLRAIYSPRIVNKDVFNDLKDAKTLLQEYLQGRKLSLPEYHLTEVKGQQHNQEFIVTCDVKALDKSAVGSGETRRKAEKNAARALLAMIKERK